MEFLKQNAQRARNAILVMKINVAVMIIDMIASSLQLRLLNQIESGEYSEEAVQLNDMFQMAWKIGMAILSIFTIVIFIQWFRRAYYNLNTQMDNLENSEGWAAGYWFIPFANLYQPYKIMKELFTASDILLANRQENYIPKYPRSLVLFWWWLWVIGSIINNFAVRASWKATTIKEFIGITTAEIVASIVLAGAAWMAFRVIKSYSKMEDQIAQMEDYTSNDLSRHLTADE